MELDQELGDPVGDVLVDAGVDRDLARPTSAVNSSPGSMWRWISAAGIGLGDLLDVHAAHPGEDRQELLLGAVEDDRRVVLGVDLRGLLDPELVDGEAADVHAEDRLGVLRGLVAVVGDLDAARLAALADPHLGLDHARIADLLGRLDRRVNGVGLASLGHGHAVLGEQLLALILE